MSSAGERILYMMKRRGINKEELCEKAKLGKVSLERYLSDYSLPDSESLKRIAEVLKIPTGYITGETDAMTMAEPITKIPVFSEFPGKVTSKEDIREFKAIGHITGNYARADMALSYFVIAKDDSMIYAKIGAGDKVLINPEKPVESGSLAAVSVDEGECRIRRIFIEGSKVKLKEESAFPKTEIYDTKEHKVTFLGSVVFVISYPL